MPDPGLGSASAAHDEAHGGSSRVGESCGRLVGEPPAHAVPQEDEPFRREFFQRPEQPGDDVVRVAQAGFGQPGSVSRQVDDHQNAVAGQVRVQLTERAPRATGVGQRDHERSVPVRIDHVAEPG